MDLNESAYEAMLIQLDQESPNELLDNVLYYIAGFVVRSLLKVLKCGDCRSALLLDADDPHALHKEQYPFHAKLACFKTKWQPHFSISKCTQNCESC